MFGRRLGGLIAAVVLGAAGGGPARAAEPYDINVILSLSGQGAFVGRSQAQAVGAAEGLINRAGGINGRPVRLVIQDDQTDPALAVQLYNGILAKHVPVVLGPGFAAPCYAVLPLVKTDIVQYCLVPSIHPPPGAYTFSSAVSTKDLAAAGLRYLRLRGWTKIAVIDTTDATGQDGDRILKENLELPENRDLKVVAFEHFTPADATVAAQMWRIKASGAQAIYAWVTGRPFGTVLFRAYESKFDIPILTNEGNVSNEQMAQYRAFFPRQVYFTGLRFLGRNPVGPQPIRDAQRRFSGALRAKGIEPDLLSGTAWDPVMVVVDALRHVGTEATAKQVHDYIEQLHAFPGIDGFIDFRDGSQRGLTADAALIVRWDVQSREWIPVSKPGGTPL